MDDMSNDTTNTYRIVRADGSHFGGTDNRTHADHMAAAIGGRVQIFLFGQWNDVA